MPYEIPAEIEYKEKIVFGLNFKQLLIILPFLLLVLVIFKTNHNIYIKGVASAFVLGLAGLFMFFDLGGKIKTFLNWKKNTFLNTRNFNYFIGVKEIKNNYIHLPDKNKRVAILKVQPINFTIKTDEEKDTIVLQFQKLLNSIDFPIQILINTDTLDIKDYLDSLKRRIKKNKLYKKLFKQYQEYITSTIAKNSIMNRNFYLVIPEATNIENQIEICLDKLENLNLKVEILKDEELEELVNKFLIKEEKNVENNIDFLKLDNKLNRVISAYGYPRVVEAGFLDKLISSIGNFDISLHIQPESIETTMVMLNKELQKQRADLYSAELKGILNPALEIKYNDTKRLLEDLQKGKDKLFNVSLYINVKADSLEELDSLSRKVESELNSLLIIPQVASYKMLAGYKSIVPIANDALGMKRNITTYSLSAFFPFTSPFLQLDNSGVWLGLNKNNIPIIRDIFKLSNANGLILASSGSGKSFFAKLLIERYLLNRTKVIVIDPQGEYKNLVKIFGGELIELSRTSETMINPLDLMGHDYSEKRLSLMDLMPVMLGDLTEPQKSFIDRALTEAYEKNGISEDPSTWNNEEPILKDVLEILESYEKNAITLEKTTIRSLINRLSMYVDGVFSFMNRDTNIDFNNNFVCFDIGNMPKQVKPVMMFLILDYVYMKMKSDLDRKLLVIDEAWSLLSRTEDASYIFEIVKTCRKFNLGLLLINQEVEGMLNSEAGKSVLANSSYTLLMRQKPAVIKDVDEVFNLSKMEKHTLLTASVGEGLLLIEDDHSEIKVVASEEEHRLITTNPDEIMKQNKSKKKKSKSANKVKPKKRVKIKVDAEKRFYRHGDLTLPEVKYLLSKGYQETLQKSCFSNYEERYLLKPRFNESIQHFFLTIDVANYLKNKGLKVELFTTAKPDIVFTIGKKKIGIEVETGKIMKYAKKQLKTKTNLLNKNYDDWFFIVMNKNFASKYRKFGKVFEMRYLKNQLDKYLKNAQNSPK
ncbi:MAG: hypothetical protein CMH62_03830 [Nanoarchaeota archaeon]|nr:hypothetical protein [Nanoarchaeota archaeon]